MPVISSHLGSVWREESLMIYSPHTCTPHWCFSFDGLMTVGFAMPVGVTDAQICIVHTCHCMNPFHTILMIVWKEIQGILSPVLICLNEHGWSWQCLAATFVFQISELAFIFGTWKNRLGVWGCHHDNIFGFLRGLEMGWWGFGIRGWGLFISSALLISYTLPICVKHHIINIWWIITENDMPSHFNLMIRC